MDKRVLAAELPREAEVFETKIEGPEGPVYVTKTRRADLLGNMLARRQVVQYQFAAGERLQNAFETLGTNGAVRAMDFSKPFVDGGSGSGASISDAQIRAGNDIRKARNVLGLSGYRLVREILAENKTIGQIVKERGIEGSLAEKHVGFFFRDCLDGLAEAFGLTVRGASHRPQSRDKHARLAARHSV